MVAAISATILSRRSWAETSPAMVSRSRLNRTRGPPDALRIYSNPLPRGQPAGWPGAGVKLKMQQFYSFGDAASPRSARDTGRISIAKTVAQFAIRLVVWPYNQLSLALP